MTSYYILIGLIGMVIGAIVFLWGVKTGAAISVKAMIKMLKMSAEDLEVMQNNFEGKRKSKSFSERMEEYKGKE